MKKSKNICSFKRNLWKALQILSAEVIFYTRVFDDTKHARAEEVFRRFVNVTPSATKEKIREAIKITFKRNGLLPEEYDEQVVSRKDKEKSRVIVSEIVAKN